MKPVAYSGAKFGRLTLKTLLKVKWEPLRWEVICDCGKEKVVAQYSIVSGATKSCGCLQKESAKRRSIPDNVKETSIYSVWKAMLRRCENPDSSNYAYYGGRGIKVCERWHDFNLFYSDVGERPTPLHSIDRKDNTGDYTPDNFRWATKAEQTANRRNAVTLEYRGQTYRLQELADMAGVSYLAFWMRLRRGCTVEQAVHTVPYSKIRKEA